MIPLARRLLLAGCLICLLPRPASALEDEPPRVRIGWSETAPVIDGRMDEAVWQQGALIDRFIQVLPVPGAEPSQRTEVRILTDGKTLFVGFRCYDTDPEQIVARRMLRDNFPFFDDRVAIAIDTFHDHRNGYFFETNPNAMRHDVLVEGENFETSWDTIWFVETSVDAEGWTAEIAIPYSSISFDPSSDTWGFNVNRGVRRIGEEVRWADPAPQRFISDVGNAGVLEGMTGLDQGLGIEITPSLNVRYRDEPRRGDKTKVDPSLDAFYKVLPSVTAAVTANTDFGDVEVDERRINLDRFALFFPEKRDFFLEDALIFGFGDISQNGRPFFSRRIGISDLGKPVGIDVGGKLTGRSGPVKFGLLDTYLEGHEGRSAQNLLVGRAAANVFGESTIGTIVTHGDPNSVDDASTLGFDFLYRDSNLGGTGNSARASLWYAKSINEGIKHQDNGYGVKLEYPNDLVNWLLGFEELQAHYAPALGFVNRPDIRHWFGLYRYRTRPVHPIVNRIDHRVFGQIILDTHNVLESINLDFTLVEVANQIGDGIALSVIHRTERPNFGFSIDRFVIPPAAYDFQEGSARVFSSRNRAVSVAASLGYGTFYDGERLRVSSGLEWRPSRHWVIDLDYEFNDFHFPKQPPRAFDQPRTVTDGATHIVRFRVGLQFTPDISWINFVQYDNVSDTASLNSRFRWAIQDGREFFIVINQGVGFRDQTVTSPGMGMGKQVRSLGTELLVKAVWTFSF